MHTVSERRTKRSTLNKRLQNESNAAVAECGLTPKKRKTSPGKNYRNRTRDIYVICKKTLIGKSQTKYCKT